MGCATAFVFTIVTFMTQNAKVSASLSVYTASVAGDIYPSLLGGSNLLENIYSTYNRTGLMAIGGILLAAGGKIVN